MIQIPEWIWPIAAVLLTATVFYYGRRKEREEQITAQAILNSNINMLIAKTDAIDKNLAAALGGIETRFEAIGRKQDEHTERIAKVEESAKQAHRRIDEIRN